MPKFHQYWSCLMILQNRVLLLINELLIKKKSCSVGSFDTSLQHSARRSVVKSRTSLCRIEMNPPFGKDNAGRVWREFHKHSELVSVLMVYCIEYINHPRRIAYQEKSHTFSMVELSASLMHQLQYLLQGLFLKSDHLLKSLFLPIYHSFSVIFSSLFRFGIFLEIFHFLLKSRAFIPLPYNGKSRKSWIFSE